MNSSGFLSSLGRASLEAGALVLIVLAVQGLVRKRLAPRWSCALWLLVMVRLLPFSIPSSTSIFNLVPKTKPVASSQVVAERASVSPEAQSARLIEVAESVSFSERVAKTSRFPQPESTRAWSWATVLFWTWLTGFAVFLSSMLHASLRFHHRLGIATTVDELGLLRVLRDCCDQFRLPRMPVVKESAAVAAPGLYGLIRPRILVPSGCTARFTSAELRFVFLHELAHLKRRDLWLNWAVTILQAAHWFNPIVWIGFARWRTDREIACDAMALEAVGGAERYRYGETIMKLLDGFVAVPAAPGVVGILEEGSQLRRRLRRLGEFRPSSWRSSLAGILLGGIALVGLTDARIPAAVLASPNPELLSRETGSALDRQSDVIIPPHSPAKRSVSTRTSAKRLAETVKSVTTLGRSLVEAARSTPAVIKPRPSFRATDRIVRVVNIRASDEVRQPSLEKRVDRPTEQTANSNRLEHTPEPTDPRELKWRAAMMTRVRRRIKERENLTDQGVERFIDWNEPLLLKTLSEMRGDLHLEDQQISDACLILVYRIRLTNQILGDPLLTAAEKKARMEGLKKSWRRLYSRAIAADQKENRDFKAGLLYGYALRPQDPGFFQDREFSFMALFPSTGTLEGPGDLHGSSPQR